MSFYLEGLKMMPDGTSRSRRLGEYWTHDEAVAAAKHLIDSFLLHEHLLHVTQGITPQQLLARYRSDAEQPCVLRSNQSSTNVSAFNHLEYATLRCAEICNGGNKH